MEGPRPFGIAQHSRSERSLWCLSKWLTMLIDGVIYNILLPPPRLPPPHKPMAPIIHACRPRAVSVSIAHSFGSKPTVVHSARAVAEHAAEARAMAGAHLPCNASNCCTVAAAAKISARRGDLGDSYTGSQPSD